MSVLYYRPEGTTSSAPGWGGFSLECLFIESRCCELACDPACSSCRFSIFISRVLYIMFLAAMESAEP
jgi:hypothetical protein